MDEEKNNEQDPAQKTGQDVQDTVNAVKDGANLAKDVTTGNAIGAIKHGLSLLKNKKARKILIISMIIPIITTLILTSGVFVIFDAVGNAIQTVIDAIRSLFKINSNSWDGTIEITDEQVDQAIQCIKDLNIKLENLRLSGDIDSDDNDTEEERLEKEKKAARVYVKKFLEAQFVTETPHYEPSTKSGKTYGKVYLYRTSDTDVVDENTVLKEMEWMSYEKMQKAAEKGKLDSIKNSYSIDEEGKLVIPQWTIINTKVNGSSKPEETIINLRHIDYKSVISQYTSPVNFLIYLTMVSENPEFVRAVTELIKQNTKIDITVLDKVTTTVNTEVDGQTWNQKSTSKPTKKQGVEIKKGETTKTSREEKTETITTATSTDPMLKVTYAKTWFSEQRVTYNLTQQDPYKNSQRFDKTNSEELKDDKEADDPPEGERSSIWYTKKYITINTNATGTVYKEGTRGDVTYLGGKKGDKGVTPDSYSDATKKEVKAKFNINEDTTFVGLMDDFFRIPNAKEYEAAGQTNLATGAEWLFSLLQKDSALQGLEKVMRYVMQKYTGRDYGVDDSDLQIFDIRNFVTVSTQGGALEEILKSYENNALRIYMNGEIELYDGVKKFVTQDKKYYKMFYTDNDHCLNIAYGIVIRNSKGEFINADLFEEYGVPIEKLKELASAYDRGEEAKIEVEIVNKVYSALVARKKDEVKEEFAKRGEELKENQVDSLVCVSFQYGNFGQKIKGSYNIVDLYINYYKKGDDGNVEKFKNNAQVQVDAGRAHVFTNDTSRKIANWRLFHEGKYILSDNTEISAGGAEGMTALQQKVVEVAINWEAYGARPSRAGLCQAWVYLVYLKAGACNATLPCARLAAYAWAASTDFSQIQPGAAIYSNSPTSVHGHVGIYIGDGQVLSWVGDKDHPKGFVKTEDIGRWLSYWRADCWGWNGGQDLTGGSYPSVGGLIPKPTHAEN